MTIKPTTAPILLMAAGGLLLAAGLVGMNVPIIIFGAVFLGLGFWSLRGGRLSPVVTGPLLLALSAVALCLAGLVSGQVIMFVMALSSAGLACFAWLRAQG